MNENLVLNVVQYNQNFIVNSTVVAVILNR